MLGVSWEFPPPNLISEENQIPSNNNRVSLFTSFSGETRPQTNNVVEYKD